MKTYSLFGRKDLDIEKRELELPALSENSVLVKVHACGVCGTDLNFVRDWSDAHQPLGHEIAGEVIETGRGVSSVRPGDKIIVEDCTMCGKCVDCKSGHPELCRSMYTLNGFPGMSEYIVVNEANVVAFEGMDYVSACLTEPLAVAYNAVLAADIPLGGSVMIFGPGPIGLLIAALAKMRGAGFVGITCLTAKSVMENARIELAGKLGCNIVIPTDTQDIHTEVRTLFLNGVDRVIVTSPPKSMSDAFRIIRYGGIITFLGLSFKEGRNIIEFDVNHAIFNKITLRPFFAEPAIHFHPAAKLIKSGSIQAASFQTHFCNFSNVSEVLGNALAGSIPVIKPVFLPWKE
jgi:L-iditol 2-dehydrogenase